MNQKIIAVTGATGAQGGGLVRSILTDETGEFRVRAITRDAHGPKAVALEAMGVEVVTANLDDEESLKRAFQGAYGAYCVTNFWEHFSAPRELVQAGNLARAAAAAEVQHVIWSTLEDTRRWVPLDDPRMPTLHGTYKVPHFDAKGEADALFLEGGAPATCMRTSFYWDNLISFGMGPRRGADGRLAFVLPMADKKLPGIAASDIGRCAHGIFARGAALMGQTIGVAGEHPTGAEMASDIGEVLGEEVVYAYVPPEIYRTFPFPGADDLANMFQFKRDFEQDYCGARDVELSRRLAPGLHTFRSWLGQVGSAIPIG